MKGITKLAAAGAAAGAAFAAVCITKKAAKLLRAGGALPKNFTCTAHTGCEGTPDNTLASLQKAIALDVPVAEVDVTLCADGTPVLLHAPFAEQGEGVLLSDALAYVHTNSEKLQLNLDLKVCAAAQEVQRLIEENDMRGRCFFTGVEEQDTQSVKIDAPHTPFYLNIEPELLRVNDAQYCMSLVYKVQQSGAVGINCSFRHASRRLVEIFHREGLRVSLWTVDSKPMLRYALCLAPDNITTRYPTRLFDLRQFAH